MVWILSSWSEPDLRTSVADRLPVLDKSHDKSLQTFKRWLVQKQYSKSTQNTYIEAARLFLRYWHQKGKVDLQSFTPHEINAFNHDYIVANGFSRSYQNQMVNSLKLFFKTVEGLRLKPDEIERPRREHRLPHVLSKAHVKRLLEKTGNTNHRTMLSLIYACSLRRGVLLALRLSDIDGERKVLWIRAGKGEKDRMIPISVKLLAMLRACYKGYRPKVWLFEGEMEGTRYGEKELTTCFQASRMPSRHTCRGYLELAKAQLRHSFTGGGYRPAFHSNPLGPQEFQGYRNLHACEQSFALNDMLKL